jgi:Zn-dependent peptidase ImmA (M78 family)
VSFNPARFGTALKRAMLTQKKFADEVGVSRQAISKWGVLSEPTAENLKEIKRITGYPKEFFFGPDIDEPEAATTSFRSQTAMTAGYRDAALAAGAIGFLVSDWVASKFNLPPINVPDLHLYADKPETAAQVLRQEWGLGQIPIANMIHLLESKGVQVFSLTENTRTVNAYSLWRRRKPYVFLNNFKSAECSRFDAAHELAHLTLHQDGSVKGREAENQANRFASAFLMPKSDVVAELPRVSGLNQIIQKKLRWKVSVAALNYRLRKLDITSEWMNREMCIEISKRGYHKSEPNGIEWERSSVWEKVLKSLWSERSNHAQIAEEIHVPEVEVADLLFGVLISEPPKVPIVLPEPVLLERDEAAKQSKVSA